MLKVKKLELAYHYKTFLRLYFENFVKYKRNKVTLERILKIEMERKERFQKYCVTNEKVSWIRFSSMCLGSQHVYW